MKGRWSAVMALFLAASAWASLAARSPDQFRPPINLRVDPFVQPVVDRMWQASPTFRRQCRRLAAEPDLQVTVSREDEPTRSSFANARTALTFEGNVPVAAHVFLKTTVNGPELIAHELEHILEQLDRVDLQAQAGNGVVWKSDRASFETRRAIEIGRRVAREITDGATARASATSDFSNGLDSPVTLKLRDRDAGPVSARTARVSGDGRYVVFISSARLVDEDRNSLRDVYVTDLATRRTTLESLGPTGAPADGDTLQADISQQRSLRGVRIGSRQPDRPVVPGGFSSDLSARSRRRNDASSDHQPGGTAGEWTELESCDQRQWSGGGL